MATDTLPRARAKITERTLRRDAWWGPPLVSFVVLTAFVAYATWAAFANKDYYAGARLHRDYISPFYSPCVSATCPAAIGWWHWNFWRWLSPAIYILIFPLGFRLTCYYYRKAYYRAFWMAPPACAVAEPHAKYTGESRFPLVLQNVHRYFWLAGLVFNVILTYDAVVGYRGFPGIGMGLGSLVLTVNAVLLWLYTLSCHSCRHIVGGRLNSFSQHPLRYRFWTLVSRLNAKHMQIAWLSLVWVALTDLYVRLVAASWIHDVRFF